MACLCALTDSLLDGTHDSWWHVCVCRVVHFEDELYKEEEDEVMHEKRIREKVGPSITC